MLFGATETDMVSKNGRPNIFVLPIHKRIIRENKKIKFIL